MINLRASSTNTVFETPYLILSNLQGLVIGKKEKMKTNLNFCEFLSANCSKSYIPNESPLMCKLISYFIHENRLKHPYDLFRIC